MRCTIDAMHSFLLSRSARGELFSFCFIIAMHDATEEPFSCRDPHRVEGGLISDHFIVRCTIGAINSPSLLSRSARDESISEHFIVPNAMHNAHKQPISSCLLRSARGEFGFGTSHCAMHDAHKQPLRVEVRKATLSAMRDSFSKSSAVYILQVYIYRLLQYEYRLYYFFPQF